MKREGGNHGVGPLMFGTCAVCVHHCDEVELLCELRALSVDLRASLCGMETRSSHSELGSGLMLLLDLPRQAGPEGEWDGVRPLRNYSRRGEWHDPARESLN